MPLLDTKTVSVATVLAPTAPPAVPTLSSPPNGATGVSVPVTLSWSPAEGAASYRVQVALDNAFSSIVFDRAEVPSPQVSVSGLEPNTRYFWRVAAANPVGTSGWSEVWNFTTSAEPADIWGPMMGMFGLMLMMGMIGAIIPTEEAV